MNLQSILCFPGLQQNPLQADEKSRSWVLQQVYAWCTFSAAGLACDLALPLSSLALPDACSFVLCTVSAAEEPALRLLSFAFPASLDAPSVALEATSLALPAALPACTGKINHLCTRPNSSPEYARKLTY